VVSLGAERVFRIRADKKIVLDLKMPDNSYVIMGGKMQQQFTHEVPKSKKVIERRISITFRKFV
jgi:alkylated DNA repair dioxygenase AlkB